VGAAVGGLFVIAAIIFAVVKLRWKRRTPAAHPESYQKQEIDSTALPRTHGRSELEETKAPVELDVNNTPHERSGGPDELQGTAVAELNNSPMVDKGTASDAEGMKVGLASADERK
jgi:hypothetical protein